MDAFSEWVYECVDGYLNPPTPEDEMRRARVKVRRRLCEVERKIVEEERTNVALSKKIEGLAIKGDQAAMRVVARTTFGCRGSISRLRKMQSTLISMQGHLDDVDVAVTIRGVLGIAADALVAVGGVAREGVADEARNLHHQLEELRAIEERASDALAGGDEELVIEDMVDKIIDEATAAVINNLPSAPGGGSMGGGMSQLERVAGDVQLARA